MEFRPVTNVRDHLSAISRPLEMSAYVICHNEAPFIEACLRSLAFCGQIVVVDSGSTDGTLETVRALAAEGLPVELHEREWAGYAAQKQYALEQCHAEWCLNLDADETAAPDFAERAAALLAVTGANGIRVARRIAFHDGTLPPRSVSSYPLLRIVRRGVARYDLWTKVHERLAVDGTIATEPDLVVIDHRALPATEQLAKEARYAELKAAQLHEAGRRWSAVRLLLNPPYAFLRAYLVRRYALAGWNGLVRSLTIAAYAFVTEARLRELNNTSEGGPLRASNDDFRDRENREGS